MARAAHDGVPDTDLVARLIGLNLPELATENIRPSATSGSSNWVFRIGENHAVRLPRTDAYAEDPMKEVTWVPQLAPELSVPVPDVALQGEPSVLFSRPWTVVTWVPGDLPGDLGPEEQGVLAQDPGQFIRSLHALDAHEASAGPEHWGYRCREPVTETIDGWLDTAAAGLSDMFDPHRIRQAWRKIREVPAASAPACWVHTDLSAENILVEPGGRLAGVIDFGGLGVGDRSVDMLYAWSVFDRPAREAFRSASGADETTWVRARAWAFVGPGLLTILGYQHSMPSRTARLSRMVEALAGDVGVPLR